MTHGCGLSVIYLFTLLLCFWTFSCKILFVLFSQLSVLRGYVHTYAILCLGVWMRMGCCYSQGRRGGRTVRSGVIIAALFLCEVRKEGSGFRPRKEDSRPSMRALPKLCRCFPTSGRRRERGLGIVSRSSPTSLRPPVLEVCNVDLHRTGGNKNKRKPISHWTWGIIFGFRFGY